ncbi:MAG: dihydrolipoamide acetyltransferase family protein [Vicingaceae bacterium]
MATIEVKLPKMGESIKEATVLNWLKKSGESVEKDEPILEVATDKVDSEVAAPESGVLKELKYQENDVVAIGEVIATIDTEAEGTNDSSADKQEAQVEEETTNAQSETKTESNASSAHGSSINRHDEQGRFFSPLVRSMAEKEGVSMEELSQIKGSGSNGRVLKKDLQAYLKSPKPKAQPTKMASSQAPNQEAAAGVYEGRYEVLEMDRMRGMISDHMVYSKQTSPHVTAYVEVDVTKIVNWRNKVKEQFQQKHGEKITFTPIFVETVVKAIQEFPMINVSVDGKKIIAKKDINIGLAAALPTGNLIVPVIKEADKKNLLGLTSSVNDLVEKARTNKLAGDEIKGSTFTISNVGTFRNVMGTPIINQPEAAILATGAIRKKPAVVETDHGDMIAIRQMMYLSLSFDHRVVDGNLGGSFLARIMDHLEAFDENRAVG